MRGPARLMALLAVAAATQVAAASDRFVPPDRDFVVANIRQALPDEELRGLLAAWRADPEAEASTVALAGAFIERARRCVSPYTSAAPKRCSRRVATRPGASARRCAACTREVLQFRHDFPGAEALLDAVPARSSARFRRARRCARRSAWCAEISPARAAIARNSPRAAAIAREIGFACLAEALAGSGQLDRAQALLDSRPSRRVAHADPLDARAYLLATRAELRERSQDLDGAIADYRAALTLAPRDDSIRAALADALAARGDARRSARRRSPSKTQPVALLVRGAALSAGAERAELTRARAGAWLELEAARGDAMHYREAAMLALAGRQCRRGRSTRRAGTSRCRRNCPTCACWRAPPAPRGMPQPCRRCAEWLRRRVIAIRSPKAFSMRRARS